MSSFSQDTKWAEAKRAVGNLNWLEVISYYRSIGGKNVFVYSVIEGDKRLIVDILDNERVVLVNKNGEPVIDSYTAVESSRKVFKYSEKTEQVPYMVGNKEYLITIESHK
jgi:hypothetical protein